MPSRDSEYLVTVHHGSLSYNFGGVLLSDADATRLYHATVEGHRRKKLRGPQPTIRLWKLLSKEIAVPKEKLNAVPRV